MPEFQRYYYIKKCDRIGFFRLRRFLFLCSFTVVLLRLSIAFQRHSSTTNISILWER
jgi:hypothetical protein